MCFAQPTRCAHTGYAVLDPDEFVAEPESPHRAYVDADATAPARVLAIGAPKADDVQVYEEPDGEHSSE